MTQTLLQRLQAARAKQETERARAEQAATSAATEPAPPPRIAPNPASTAAPVQQAQSAWKVGGGLKMPKSLGSQDAGHRTAPKDRTAPFAAEPEPEPKPAIDDPFESDPSHDAMLAAAFGSLSYDPASGLNASTETLPHEETQPESPPAPEQAVSPSPESGEPAQKPAISGARKLGVPGAPRSPAVAIPARPVVGSLKPPASPLVRPVVPKAQQPATPAAPATPADLPKSSVLSGGVIGGLLAKHGAAASKASVIEPNMAMEMEAPEHDLYSAQQFLEDIQDLGDAPDAEAHEETAIYTERLAEILRRGSDRLAQLYDATLAGLKTPAAQKASETEIAQIVNLTFMRVKSAPTSWALLTLTEKSAVIKAIRLMARSRNAAAKSRPVRAAQAASATATASNQLVDSDALDAMAASILADLNL